SIQASQSDRRANFRSMAQLSQLPSSNPDSHRDAGTHSVSLDRDTLISRLATTVGGVSSITRMYLYHSLWFQQWSAASYRTSVNGPSQPSKGILIGLLWCE